MNKTIHIVAGPTASGKSAHALDLARTQNGVIINCDSMQIYDALPILTAQPSAEDFAAAPHKLYAHLHPNTPTSAGDWSRLAAPIIEDALANDQTPIICGGTGLYIKALQQGLSPIPDIPPKIRATYNQRLLDEGSPALHAELEARDPAMKGRFHKNHSARIIRALEVLDATGKSLSHWQDQPLTPPPSHWTFKTHIIIPDRADLHARINTRFDWMMDNGALEETAAFIPRLKSNEINENALITKALGLKEIRAHLNGTLSREDAIEQAQTSTRQYAKRQITWFRNQLS